MAKSKAEREELRKARIIKATAKAAETLSELSELAGSELGNPDGPERAMLELATATMFFAVNGTLDDMVRIIQFAAEEAGVPLCGTYQEIFTNIHRKAQTTEKMDPAKTILAFVN